MNLLDICSENGALHLIIWDRFDALTHEQAMLLVRDLMKGDQAQNLIVMVRPLGRKPGDYDILKTDFADIAGGGIPYAPNYGGRTLHCELFIQISPARSDMTTPNLEEWVRSHDRTFGFFHHKAPVWFPFEEQNARQEYARSLRDRDNRSISTLSPNELAAFLKMIWQRASEYIADRIDSAGGFQPFDPRRDVNSVLEFMKVTLSDIYPRNFELRYPDDIVDPASFGVSHMTAFGINALTKAHDPPLYQIEHFVRGLDNATSPCCFRSRSDFINYLRSVLRPS